MKVGDWVKITKYDNTWFEKYQEHMKDNEHYHIEKWEPKKGEWCWFWNTDMNFAVLGKYYGFELNEYICIQYSSGNYQGYTFCEPFNKKLPTFLEDQHENKT